MAQNNRQEVLTSHYRWLLKKVASWVSVVAMISTILIPGVASAAQLTSRSTTLVSSSPSAVTNYTFTFNPGTTGNIGAIKFELCDSPLPATACANSTGSSGVSYTSNSASLTGQTGISGFTTGTGTPAAPTTNTFWITKAAPTSVSTATQVTVTISNIRNPSATNTSFYTKISTFSDAAGTAAVDAGSTAQSTARQITVSANVQESLVFCVGTAGTSCASGGLTGTSVNLGTGTDNVLSASAPSGGSSLMAADTNATTGYVITYITSSPGGTGGTTCAGSLSSTNDCITDAGGSAGTFTAGTSKFGINLVANTTPASLGAAVSGSGTGTVSAPYGTANNFAFQGGTTPRTVASASGPTVPNLYTVSYAAQAGNTTKPGGYSAIFTYVCTGTF